MAETVFLDLNCTPPEVSNSRIIPGEGNFAAHEDANTLAQDQGGDSVAAGIVLHLPLPRSSVGRIDVLKICWNVTDELEMLI